MCVCVETNGLFMEIIWNLYTKNRYHGLYDGKL